MARHRSHFTSEQTITGKTSHRTSTSLFHVCHLRGTTMRRFVERAPITIGGDLVQRRRTGAAVVEFAVCIPVLILLVLGSIEATSMIFLKQALQSATHEATRQAVLSTTTNQQVSDQVANILDARDIVGFRVEFPRGNPEGMPRGSLVTVRVTASSSRNSPLAGKFLRNRDIVVSNTMLKE